MNQNEIKEVLRLHKLWLKNDPKGHRAELQRRDLKDVTFDGANLENANLKLAFLENASFYDANLRDAKLKLVVVWLILTRETM